MTRLIILREIINLKKIIKIKNSKLDVEEFLKKLKVK